VHAGHDLEGVDESVPYPEHFHGHYAATKALAEQAVMAAHGPELATVSLRPHLMWGPGDTQLTPRLVERARAGRLKLVGPAPGPMVDTTWIDDAAEAHLLAYDRLGPDAACGGKTYFISQGDPQPVSVVVDGIMAAYGLPPCDGWVSPKLAYVVGAICEVIWRTFRLKSEPPMTRFVANQLATAHWYDLSAARRDLGYAPTRSVADGIAELKAHVAEHG